MSPFPLHRPRRLRENRLIRELIAQTHFSLRDLIYPLFVIHGKGIRNPISSMPGIFQLSVDQLQKEAQELQRLRIPAVLLFGIPETKDSIGSSGFQQDNIICQAIQTLKEQAPEIVVIADVCLCEYTSHGHCGIVRDPESPGFQIENDKTLELLSEMSVRFAQAGADLIAPSDMMDGRVRAIRNALDAIGRMEVPILSYAVKYASSFYAPFREAADSKPQWGDRMSYQMNPANQREAIVEARLDLEEGADLLMVKPALAYLDVIQILRERFEAPIVAYQVSGEYAMIKAAAEKGFIDEKKVRDETLLSIKRAGADLIVTYFAKQIAQEM